MANRRLIPDVVTNQSLILLPERASVRSAVEVMAARDIGAVVITEREQLRGIFTERDVLKRVVAADIDPDGTRLSEVMTRNPLTLPSEASPLDALKLMRSRRIRHLPVVDDGRIKGIVSIRDLFDVVQDSLQEQVQTYETLMFGLGGQQGTARR